MKESKEEKTGVGDSLLHAKEGKAKHFIKC